MQAVRMMRQILAADMVATMALDDDKIDVRLFDKDTIRMLRALAADAVLSGQV